MAAYPLRRNAGRALRTPSAAFGGRSSARSEDAKGGAREAKHQRILTTHAGSLPRPDDLMALYAATHLTRSCYRGFARPWATSFTSRPSPASTSSTTASSARRCGARWTSARGGPTSIRASKASKCAKSMPRRVARLGPSAARNARSSPNSMPPRLVPPRAQPAERHQHVRQLYGLICTGPVKYIGHAAIKRDIDNSSRSGPRQRRGRGVHAGGVARDAADHPNAHYRAPRTTPARWPRRSAKNTRPSSMRASSCRSTTRRWSTSTTGGSR